MVRPPPCCSLVCCFIQDGVIVTFVYVAQAIDRAAGGLPAEFETLIGWLSSRFVVYRPGSAFRVPSPSGDGDSAVRDVNMAALDRADALVVALPDRGVPSWGVPAEIERALVTGKPVVLVERAGAVVRGGWSAQYGDRVSYFPVDGSPEAFVWLLERLVRDAGTGVGLSVVKLSEGARVPSRAHSDDAGLDLYVSQEVVIPAGGFRDVPCGVAVELPAGSWGLLTGRSSTMRRRGLLMVQGVIDVGYRGELFAGVFNVSGGDVAVGVGERLSQLIVLPNLTETLTPVVVESLSESERGVGGFGSSGW